MVESITLELSRFWGGLGFGGFFAFAAWRCLFRSAVGCYCLLA